MKTSANDVITPYYLKMVCKFYQSAEDFPDPRELSSEKKILIVFDDLLLEK